jgi:hypothetical protein
MYGIPVSLYPLSVNFGGPDRGILKLYGHNFPSRLSGMSTTWRAFGQCVVGSHSTKFYVSNMSSRKSEVQRATLTLEGCLLANQVFLCDFGDWEVARVDAEAGGGAGRAQVVMGRSRVPYYQVARFDADLLPLEAPIFQPFHSTVRETIPLFCPIESSISLEFFGPRRLRAYQAQILSVSPSNSL